MGPSTNKKVLVSRFDRDTLAGFVNQQTYLTPAGIELLSTSGIVLSVPFEEIRSVWFVRDFQNGEPKQEMRAFTARPKMAGLWIRMHFRDGETLEGVLANNLLQLDGMGFMVVPPDAGVQTQRIFIPRTALTKLEVLGVVGSPLRRRKPKPAAREQLEMFGR